MKRKKRTPKYPIAYWSHSSLISYLRNPLAWYKRYVEKIYDTPRTPASVIGSSGHKALEHYYSGVDKETSLALGLEYLRSISDFEINFGQAKTKKAQKEKRQKMERDYLQATHFYLEKAPKHKVLAVEVKGMAKVPHLPLSIKAISDLVVESRGNVGGVDVVDHKFVDSFTDKAKEKPLFMLQAIFNYYTVRELFGKPVYRFIVIECKKSRNADGSPQLRKHVLTYSEMRDYFEVFHRLLADATQEIARTRVFLPNPSDMFEGDNSFDIYRLNLSEPEEL